MNLKINYQTINSVKEITNKIGDHVVFDTETTGLETHNPETKIIGLGLCWAPGEAAYIPLIEDSDRKLKEFEELILNNPNIEKRGQNYKFDIRMLAARGYKFCNLGHDSSLLSYCLFGDRNSVGNDNSHVGGHGLDELSLFNFNFIKTRTKTLIPKKTKKNPNPSMLQAPQDKVATYCMEDADFTYRAINRLLELIESNPNAKKLYYEIELPVHPVLIDIELKGVYIDVKKTIEIKEKMLDIQKKSIQHISDLIGEPVEITNRDQLEDIIFNKLKLQDSKANLKLKTTKTGISVDKKNLEQFKDHEFIKELLVAKALEKNIGTYLEEMPNIVSPIDNVIHGSFNQIITTTGRLSCLTSDSKILLSDGTLCKIEDLHRKYIQDTPSVISHTGNTRKINYSYDNGIQHCFELELESGKKITCTENHKFLTKNGWKQLNMLNINDEIYEIENFREDR